MTQGRSAKATILRSPHNFKGIKVAVRRRSAFVLTFLLGVAGNCGDVIAHTKSVGSVRFIAHIVQVSVVKVGAPVGVPVVAFVDGMVSFAVPIVFMMSVVMEVAKYGEYYDREP
jgi:hypothetical protein